jgi:hypothetical protein
MMEPLTLLPSGDTSSKSNIPRIMGWPQWSRSVAAKVPDLTPLDFCLWGWMKSEDHKEEVNTRDELVTRIINSAALLKQEREDNFRRTTCTVVKKKSIEVDGRIFEHLL